MQNIMSAHAVRRRGALALALCVGVGSCTRQSPPPAPPPVEVAALEVRPQGLPVTLEHPAQLRGVREVEVRSRVSGILLKRLYREGTPVKAGDLLFRIDPAPFEAQVARARAELGVQQANLRQTQRDRERTLSLFDQKLVSLKDRDAAIAAHESASAAVAAAQAALRSAALDLSYTDVRAPISGLTSREVRSEGSLITAASDTSLLTHIVQSDRLYAEFSMPEAEAGTLRAAVLADRGGNVFVRVANTLGQTLVDHASIEFIAPSVGNQTGTVDARAIFDNSKQMFLPGQVVRTRVEGVNLAGSLVIPKRAVMHGMEGPFVWVVRPDSKIAQRPVQLGMTSGNNVVVTSGLTAGERIVVEGILKVQPGALVRAAPVTLEGAPQTPPAPAQAVGPAQKAAS